MMNKLEIFPLPERSGGYIYCSMKDCKKLLNIPNREPTTSKLCNECTNIVNKILAKDEIKPPSNVVELPEKYPQKICGIIGCNNILMIPNYEPLTSKLCEECSKIANKVGDIE